MNARDPWPSIDVAMRHLFRIRCSADLLYCFGASRSRVSHGPARNQVTIKHAADKVQTGHYVQQGMVFVFFFEVLYDHNGVNVSFRLS